MVARAGPREQSEWLSLIAAWLSLHPDGVEPLVLHLRKQQELTITLRSIETNADLGLSCVVSTELALAPRTAEAFEHLVQNRCDRDSCK